MPTYDYRCKACGHELELYQAITEGPRRKCPDCGALKLERLIGTGGAILFKGGGFYQTDYRSKSYKDAAKAEKDGAKKESGSGDAQPPKTETKKDAPKKTGSDG